MRNVRLLALGLSLLLFSSFSPNLECEYAGSNIGFAQTQAMKALKNTDLNKLRFFAYKALNALEKSKEQLEKCGCSYASKSMAETISDLKNAVKSEQLGTAQILLSRAVDHTNVSLEALAEHHLHGSSYGKDVLVLNTTDAEERSKTLDNGKVKTLNDKIDLSLKKYEASLQKIVSTVNCGEALAFAKDIYENSEAQLLKTNLSEGKKYYYLRTKEITAAAMETLADCPKEL
ncbi:hypothetical protein [Maribacter sp. 2307ULW6-5]|uniref:hypothetical protein n=1 Tax=Maribacter sp. 2307ULW6-5 TaxID=3386275 RepID=UPI0039BD2E26